MEPLLPLFPLELVLFPGAPLPLHVFEPRYKEMVNECVAEKHPFGVIQAITAPQKQKGTHVVGVGCTAEIADVLHRYDDGRMDILTFGRERFEIIEVTQQRSFLQSDVSFFDDDEGTQAAADARESALELHSEVLVLTGVESGKIDPDDARLSFQLASVLPVDLDFKQALLEMRSEEQRMKTLLDYYTRAIPKLKLLTFGRQKARTNGWAH